MESSQSIKGEDKSKQKVIFAAGGVVWRETFRGPEVAIIHRSRYGGEWCLPKGKPEESESLDETAIREVKEETGCDVKIKSFAGTTHYLVNGTSKVVLFWNMTPVGECSFKPSEEVHEMLWLSPCEAIRKLDHTEEKNLLQDAFNQRSFFSLESLDCRKFNCSIMKPKRQDRLAGSLRAYRVELERRIKHAQEKNEPDLCWIDTARRLMCEAQAALEDNDIEGGWKCFHAAQRMEIFGFERDELEAMACVLRQESDKLSSWRKKAVHELIGGPESPKGNVVRECIYQAALLRDEHYNNQYHKIGLLRHQLTILSGILLSILFVMSFIYFMVKPDIKDDFNIVYGVILFGLMGGTLSAILSSRSPSSQSRIPELNETKK
ncbi:MAG TPA: NUDIX hydrolase [Thermodesulfobacteriota bacterium]|nr:NUDIX hydrolase [Thermodesulfobacteriota bacterium]